MSKRGTLHYYFSSPPPIKKKKLEIEASVEEPKRERVSESVEEEEVVVSTKTKRTKLMTLKAIDYDSDIENEGTNELPNSDKKDSVEKRLQDSFKYEANAKNSNAQLTKVPESPAIRGMPEATPSKSLEAHDSLPTTVGEWTHCKLEWLKPHKIRDAQKRRPDHPDYDPTTLFVPPEFYKEQTPAHRQWWLMKASHFDTVLFFKVGKFYELYHMDATVGVNELGFSYMKGDFAHSGFPESAYPRMMSTLISKGYKIARVEQTETPEMMQERCKKTRQNTKWDKVVRREICQIILRGAQVYGLQDPEPGEPLAAYMVAIAEEENQGHSTYGVCFVDASIGLFHLGQFKDDKHSSRLLSTLAHYPPALIIYDRKVTTPRTIKLLRTHCHSARMEAQALLSPEETLKTLAEKYYKTNEDQDWPEGLQPFLHEGDALGLTPAPNNSLAIKALGGCASYLKYCLLDIQVLTMGRFTKYLPPDVLNRTLSEEEKVDNRWEGASNMVLDSVTLRNLRIVLDEGCLYDKINFCSTSMGKRFLYQWVCAPSCNLTVIKERQEAVKVLLENQELCQNAKSVLTKLPDLERMLAKVHSLGNSMKSKQHPDSRAIFYEEKLYSKRKVQDFISLLNGFGDLLTLTDLFSQIDAVLLKTITQFSPKGKFPDYRDSLKFFQESFNRDEAEKAGRLLPEEGVDQEYDATLRLIEQIEEELKNYLSEQERFFKCHLTYVGSDKKRYQIEVPMSAASKADSNYQMESARKGYKRFSTPKTKELLARIIAAEEQKKNVLKDISRRIFEKFSSEYHQWEAAVHCVSTLDILLSLAEFARQQSNEICLPNITFDRGTQPYIKITEGRHPCIPIVNDFIPNDTELGKGSTLLLLTGPNMGGKSTLMRQVGLLTVLAHLGSYVPAQECSLTLVDRIFTRLGASDDILAGQSTFLEEMNETAAILKHASVHSLILIDELGRGTSTYDGTAVASAVCAELADRRSRCIFSTHYHSLVHHLGSYPGVVLGHMACMVETDEAVPESEDQIPEETITFLYKLTPGSCPKSYGFNAARLAGIPKSIIRRAHQLSKKFEREAALVRNFRYIMNVKERYLNLCRKVNASVAIQPRERNVYNWIKEF